MKWSYPRFSVYWHDKEKRMKRFLALALICGATATPSLAVSTFTPSIPQLENFGILAGPSTDLDYGTLATCTSADVTYEDGTLIMGDVGYEVDLVGQNTGGGVPTHYIVIGMSLEAGALLGSDSYALRLFNDNNQPWWYSLYATDGTNSVPASWVSVDNGGSTSLSADLGDLDLSGVVTIGFVVGGSDGRDTIHTSASPVPVPSAVLLGGLGASLVGWVRRRKMM
jgi:hypothetical protein